MCQHFNEEIQVDLMFWEHHVVCHVIDKCLRFAAAGIVPDKEASTILSAIVSLWFRIFGTRLGSPLTMRVLWTPMRAVRGRPGGGRTYASGPGPAMRSSSSATTRFSEISST